MAIFRFPDSGLGLLRLALCCSKISTLQATLSVLSEPKTLSGKLFVSSQVPITSMAQNTYALQSIPSLRSLLFGIADFDVDRSQMRFLSNSGRISPSRRPCVLAARDPARVATDEMNANSDH